MNVSYDFKHHLQLTPGGNIPSIGHCYKGKQ